LSTFSARTHDPPTALLLAPLSRRIVLFMCIISVSNVELQSDAVWEAHAPPLPRRSRPGPGWSLQLRVPAPVKPCGCVLCRVYCQIIGQCSEQTLRAEGGHTGVAGAPETASQVRTHLSERPRPGYCKALQPSTVQGVLSDTCDTQPAHIRSGRPQWCRTGAGSSRIGRSGAPRSRIGCSQACDQGVCHGCRHTPRSATPAACIVLLSL